LFAVNDTAAIQHNANAIHTTVWQQEQKGMKSCFNINDYDDDDDDDDNNNNNNNNNNLLFIKNNM